jgi:hypothetical protein
MIKRLPQIYPNESVYSWLSRIYEQSGIIYSKYFCREIMIKPKERLDFNYINILNKNFKKIIDDSIGFEKLLLEHTLFKYHSRFLKTKDRKEVFNIGIHNSGLLSKKLHLPPNRIDYYLRYCPYCVEDDRKKFGECYFHIEHQIYEIHICPIHGVELIETNIVNNKDVDRTFVSLESLNKKDSSAKVDDKDINWLVSKYIFNVMNLKINIENDLPIGRYLSSRLPDEYLIDKKCLKKNLIKLNTDMNDFYKDMKINNLCWNRIRWVYSGVDINPYDVLMVAYFQNINPNELVYLLKK